MKFLVIDDEIDIREVLEMQITSLYDVEVFQANNGAEALKHIEEQGPFDLIISDFNMPIMNGGELYLKLRSIDKITPFVLCTADNSHFRKLVQQPILVTFLDKPFDDDQLASTLEKALAGRILPEQNESHLPVSINTLFKTQTNGVPLYLKLNSTQYIKVLKETSVFDKYELERFTKKKLDHLFIEKIDFKIFINTFRKNVFAKVLWNEIDSAEGLDILQSDWSLIVQGQRHFGWSESLMELTKQNIARTISLIKKNDTFKKMFDKLISRETKSYLLPHSYMLVAMCTKILDVLEWSSPSTIQKISFAALLHDIELNEATFTNKLEMIKNSSINQEVRNQLNYQLYNHGNRVAENIQRWSSCPGDVDKIISQHHEKFNGDGFPNKLNFQTIFPLAAVFIMAEDLIYTKINNPQIVLSDYLQTKKTDYYRGDLKPIFDACSKAVENI